MRGVTKDAEQEFFLGYGGRGKELLSVLAGEGIDPGRAAQAGLLFPQEGGGYRERFRGRLTFPVTDARGRVCGFGARAINDAVPKYLNSPESELYRKSALLYGLFQALPAIRNEKKVLVVEGYMDLIGLWQKGVRNVVATCGTSLTEVHARTLKRLSDTVILFFDGDIAGKRSAVRAGGPLYAAGVSPFVLFPPKGMDPDDWAKETTEAEFRDRFERATPLMEYIERAAARKYDLTQIAGKLSYLRLMGRYLPWITEPAEHRLYVQRVARSSGLPEDTVLEQVRGKGGEAPSAGAGMPRSPAGGRPEERLLLRLLSRDSSLIEEVRRNGVIELIEGDEVREAVTALSRIAEAGGRADLNEVLDGEISDAARKRISEEIVRAEMSAGEARRIYPDVVMGLRIRKLDREILRLRKEGKAAQAAGDHLRAQEMLSAQITAKIEKERLELERRTRA